MTPTHLFSASDLIANKRVKEETFNQLKNWYTAQNLPQLTDEQVALFLLSNSNDLEASKNTIWSYFKLRSGAPKVFFNRNIDAEDVQQVIQVWDFALLPVRTVDNDAIITLRLQDTDYQKFNVAYLIKTLLMVAELPLYRDPPDGLIVLVNLQGFSLLHLTKLRVGVLKTFFHYLQEGYPCRLKGIHVLNTVSFIDKLLMIVRPLMDEKLFKMIKFHSPNMDMNTFFEDHLPKNCVPRDYGGDLEQLNVLCLQTYHTLQSMKTFYAEEEKQVKAYKKVCSNCIQS